VGVLDDPEETWTSATSRWPARIRGVPAFAAKRAPTAEKLRGGYYTPDAVALFVADWVAKAGPKLLEPSCGDGAILKHLASGSQPHLVEAVELVDDEAEQATNTGASVSTGDFFEWFTPERQGTFDGVAGNPPFIRFGNWDPVQREPALALMRSVGLRPSRLTNAWVPFVVGSVLAVRGGGRVGLVLPAELLQVGYAAALRAYLIDECSEITIVSFAELLFPGVLQEVVLLLAERGRGPALVRTREINDAVALRTLVLGSNHAPRAQLHETEKWTKYFLSSEQIAALRAVRTDPRLPRLRRWAEVDVGVVSGRNSFFCLTRADAEARGLLDVTLPLVARSSQLRGVVISDDDLDVNADARTRLLAIAGDLEPAEHPRLLEYLAEGEADGVPSGYKCAIRRDWWRVPSLWVPDGFMLRQLHTHPRLVANETAATSTDTVHRVRTAPGVDMGRLAVAAFNTVTFAAAEVLGRSYGGGILELEPSEAEDLPVPDPLLVPAALVLEVDRLVRSGEIEAALEKVDEQVLVHGLGFERTEIAVLRSAWHRLRLRRNRRGKPGRAAAASNACDSSL
jgi:adenine-specific DNA methylase